MAWLAVGALLLLAGLCYWPGLGGGFLFDDLVNLDALGKRGRIDNWPAFWRYITSGTADPLGRPLSLLSFLVDARDWPADPAPFLRTNLVLHLGNGLLLFLLLRRLEQACSPGDVRAPWVALLASALWLLHPLLVSTTLYIVQREAMLPATFMLLGLLLFVRGRQRYLESDGRAGMAGMVAGVIAGTLLATLCKANGILLPLLCWVLAATVLPAGKLASATNAQSRLRRCDLVLLALPSLVVFVYLGRLALGWDADLEHRPWTIGQRALTEPRVLLDYLILLAVPRAMSGGLFNDGYLASTGLLQPWTTLPAILAVVAMVATALLWRTRHPRMSAALLFFFAGHLLESTVVPLELYYEHRNYLPAMLLFWPLTHALTRWKGEAWMRRTVAAALVVLLATTTAQRAALWGTPDRLAAAWALQHPDSPRAQAVAAMSLMRNGEHERAAELLLARWREFPADIQLAFNFVDARCGSRGLHDDETRAVAESLRRADTGQLLARQWLSGKLPVAKAGACAGLTLSSIELWIEAANSNRNYTASASWETMQASLRGELAVYRNRPDDALQQFRRAWRAAPTPDVAARHVAFLGAHGYPEAALALLGETGSPTAQRWTPPAGMPRVHAWVLERQGYWRTEFSALRSKLEEDISARRRRVSPPSFPAPTVANPQ